MKFEKFEKRIYPNSPTMHGPEMEYMKLAYDTNWMSTVGETINEVERLVCEKVGCKYGVPIFIDTEYDTWNLDPAALEKAFEMAPTVKFLVLAHLYGTPAKVDEIREICDRHNAIIIEDAAESFGATYKGKQTGNFGTIGYLSFNGACVLLGTYISCGFGISDGYKLAS